MEESNKKHLPIIFGKIQEQVKNLDFYIPDDKVSSYKNKKFTVDAEKFNEWYTYLFETYSLPYNIFYPLFQGAMDIDDGRFCHILDFLYHLNCKRIVTEFNSDSFPDFFLTKNCTLQLADEKIQHCLQCEIINKLTSEFDRSKITFYITTDQEDLYFKKFGLSPCKQNFDGFSIQCLHQIENDNFFIVSITPLYDKNYAFEKIVNKVIETHGLPGESSSLLFPTYILSQILMIREDKIKEIFNTNSPSTIRSADGTINIPFYEVLSYINTLGHEKSETIEILNNYILDTLNGTCNEIKKDNKHFIGFTGEHSALYKAGELEKKIKSLEAKLNDLSSMKSINKIQNTVEAAVKAAINLVDKHKKGEHSKKTTWAEFESLVHTHGDTAINTSLMKMIYACLPEKIRAGRGNPTTKRNPNLPDSNH